MAKAVIRFDSREVRRSIAKWRRRLNDSTPLIKAVYAIYGIKDINDHFRKEEGPSGRWARRSPATNTRYDLIRKGEIKPPPGIPRAAFNSANKVLQLTGDTRKSILPTNTRKLSRDSILVFANDPKSKKLDRGDSSKRLPARPFMWLSNKAKGLMSEAIGKMVLK